MDLRRATRMVEACAASYKFDCICQAAMMKFSKSFDFEGMASAFVHEGDDGIVLAFRGSVNPFDFISSPAHFWNVVRDWSSNLDCGLTYHKDWPGRVCRGFAHCLEHQSKIEEIRQYLMECNASRRGVWLTGHSLGGALAILEGQWLQTHGIPVHGVYTFGAPRAGDSYFAEEYRPPLYRFENKHDIVPWAPFGSIICQEYSDFMYSIGRSAPSDYFTNYHHAGILYYIDREGRIGIPRKYYIDRKWDQFVRTYTKLYDNCIVGIEDHAISEYVKVIDTNVQYYLELQLPLRELALMGTVAGLFGL